MKYLSLIIIFLLPLTLSAATAVLPVVAHTTGHAGSEWRTSATLFNVGHDVTEITLEFIASGMTVPSGQTTLTLNPGQIWTTGDLVETLSADGVGMVLIDTDADTLSRVGLEARTYVLSESGTFGQATPLVSEDDFSKAGSELFLACPSSLSHRFNFGIDTLEDTIVNWVLLKDTGEIISEREISYSGPTHEQVSSGLASFFGVINPGPGLLKAEVLQGRAYIYGSTVDNVTNDGTFQRATLLQNNILPDMIGIDTSGDGQPDILDSNHDGILDQTVSFSAGFPFGFLFKILVHDAEGDAVSISLINPPQQMYIANAATFEVYFDPDPSQVGIRQDLEVALRDGLGETIVKIPLQVTP